MSPTVFSRSQVVIASVATLPPTVKLGIKAWGRERGPVIFGWIFAAHQPGAGSMAFAAGVSPDLSPILSRLREADVRHDARTLPDNSARQVFVTDPTV